MSLTVILVILVILAFLGFATLLCIHIASLQPKSTDDVRNELYSYVDESLADVRKMVLDEAEAVKEHLMKHVNRLDRTIEMGSVRPKKPGVVPVETRPDHDFDDGILLYKCGCGWTGQFASGGVDEDKAYCPACAKELS